jgi:hypothetical protein
MSSGENLLFGVWRWRVGVSNFKRGEDMWHKESGLQKLFFYLKEGTTGGWRQKHVGENLELLD